jgi:molecular chaperone GrpE
MTNDNKAQEAPPAGAAAANDAGPATDAETLAHGEAQHDQQLDPLALAQAKLLAVEAEAAKLRDAALRSMAEAENARKRAQREVEDRVRYAVADFARDMIPVADNLRRALDSAPAETRRADEKLARFAEGVELTERELLSVFERYSIKRVAEAGVPFDHNVHQAVVQVDSDLPAGVVVAVFQPGYTLHGRLVRAAMVSVSKGNGGPPGATIDVKA